jgi:hypothetical protein
MRSDALAELGNALPKSDALRAELRSLLPAWLVSVILPLPAILFWHSSDGRSLALACLFVGCASMAAYSFGKELSTSGTAPLSRPGWGVKMVVLAVAVVAAVVLVSALLVSLNNPRDYESLLVALLIPVPSLGMVPCLTLSTRKPYAAVVFTLFLVGCMKLVGGAVVWVVYGPNSVAEGHTRMPWTDPNLLVWVFLISTGVLSGVFYALGHRQYHRIRRQRAAEEN